MSEATESILKNFSAKNCVVYFCKAIILVALLYFLAQIAPKMPSYAVAIVGAILVVLSSFVLIYHVVIKKTHKQFQLEEGGIVSRVNEGRTLSMVLCFILSVLLVLGLILEMPKWERAEWVAIAVSVPVFYFVSLLIGKRIKKEYEAPYRVSKTLFLSSIIIGALLCVFFVIIQSLEPPVIYADASEAFNSTQRLFEDSPSGLLVEMGRLTALVDGLTSYGLSKAAEFSFAWYLVARVVLVCSAFFGFANLLGVCILDKAELKRVFVPLESAKKPKDISLIKKRYVATVCILPACFVACFLVCDSMATKALESDENTIIENFVHDHVAALADLVDGRYYPHHVVERLYEEAKERSETLAEETRDALTPLINDAFDARLENVDSYLDWYYSLPADYERLAQFFTGTIEEGMANQLEQRINEGIDDSEVTGLFEEYLTQASSLKNELLEELQAHELVGVPEWLIEVNSVLSDDFLDTSLEPTEKLLDSCDRMGLSIVAGAVAGLITKHVTGKVLAKPFFGKIVNRLISALGGRSTVSLVSTVTGTAIAPGIGTAVGVVGGVAVGALTDFLFLKVDEAMNRESYKEEIIAAIEEGRAEMLSLVGTM